jgi:MoaA/NifB/PqqE/SkfB family radical SAM enzyme
MPRVPLARKIKFIWRYLRAGRIKELYNFIDVQLFWWGRHRTFYLNKLLPALGIDLFPPFIEVEPTTICNKKCKMCEHTFWKECGRHMTYEEFKGILDQFPHLAWAGLTGIGSQFLNPDYLKMLKYCKDRHAIVELWEHMNDLKENDLQALVDYGVDFFFISSYGATKKTYEKIVVGGKFDEAIKNIKRLIEIKKEKKSFLPLLNFHYIVQRDNIHEVIPFIDMIASLNTEVGEILFTQLLHPFKEIEDLCVRIDDELAEKIRQKAKETGIMINFSAAVPRNSEKAPVNCCIEYIMPFIFADGNVSVCCGTNENNQREHQKAVSLGNAFKTPFREIWNSQKYKDLRKKIRNGEFPAACLYCPKYRLPPNLLELNRKKFKEIEEIEQERKNKRSV